METFVIMTTLAYILESYLLEREGKPKNKKKTPNPNTQTGQTQAVGNHFFTPFTIKKKNPSLFLCLCGFLIMFYLLFVEQWQCAEAEEAEISLRNFQTPFPVALRIFPFSWSLSILFYINPPPPVASLLPHPQIHTQN